MQRASATCEIDTSIVALFAQKESAKSTLKLVRNGVAKLLVTCNDIPSMAEKIKNVARWYKNRFVHSDLVPNEQLDKDSIMHDRDVIIGMLTHSQASSQIIEEKI